MRVLLTGAAGFIGSHTLRRLLDDDGLQIAVLVRARSDAWRIQDLSDSVQWIEGDLTALGTAEAAVIDFAPDAVVHLAWHGVGNRLRNDDAQVQNLTGTLALLRIAQRAGTRHWIGFGSQAEYGPHNGSIAEDAATQPTTLYGVTKLSAGHYTRLLCEQHGMRYAWLRLFSAYGPQDDPDWMIPSVIRKLFQQDQPALTPGGQLWDFVYVTDVAEAVYRALTTPDATGVFNLGSGQAQTIRSVAEHIRDLIDAALPLGFGAVPYRSDQVMHLQAKIERLKTATGWSPQIGLNDGLAQTVEFYREHCVQHA